MEYIFHELQDGSLCAQHCLNSLLQGDYYSAVDLATIAEQLDKQERFHMSEAGTSTKDYERFLNEASSNYDDSGFFSIQGY
jgi:ataxin-3